MGSHMCSSGTGWGHMGSSGTGWGHMGSSGTGWGHTWAVVIWDGVSLKGV